MASKSDSGPSIRQLLCSTLCSSFPERIYPDRKGKVERGVGHAKNTPLKGKRFESMEEAQAYLDRSETSYADTRIYGTTKRQVAAMFAEDKPSLLPLPRNLSATTCGKSSYYRGR